ncbi:MAG TPA: DUF4340 domain-containing protein [Chryseolinea sp.]
MQERKNKRLAILLFALCSVTAVVYYLSRTDGTIEVDKNMFKNFDLKSINEVILESEKGKVELKFNGARWQVNNQFDADPAMIEVLFATLQQAEPKRPLAATIQDSVCQHLSEKGVKVSLMASGNAESIFFVGGNEQKTQAYFCTGTGERKSYLVTIPGYRVYTAGIFELAEKDWKNKYVFGFNWRNFQKLEAKFPKRPADNFSVSLRDDYFAVDGLATVDTAKLNDFLDDVSLLTVDEYVDTLNLSSATGGKSPVLVLMVTDIGRRTYSLELYGPADGSQNVPGLLNGAEWAFFDPRKIQNVFRPKSFFGK